MPKENCIREDRKSIVTPPIGSSAQYSEGYEKINWGSVDKKKEPPKK